MGVCKCESQNSVPTTHTTVPQKAPTHTRAGDPAWSQSSQHFRQMNQSQTGAKEHAMTSTQGRHEGVDWCATRSSEGATTGRQCMPQSYDCMWRTLALCDARVKADRPQKNIIVAFDHGRSRLSDQVGEESNLAWRGSKTKPIRCMTWRYGFDS